MDSESLASLARPDLHVAIIMDGNGRWAQRRGLPRPLGHRAGVDAVRRVVAAAPRLGIGTLTLFAFSSSNWRRPAEEVATLLQLFLAYLRADTETCAAAGVRIEVIGRRDRLPAPLRGAAEHAAAVTASGAALHLRLAIDYSGRDAIWRAARHLARHRNGARSRLAFLRLLSSSQEAAAPAPDVDLLIRTGGEQRLSDFLLWEAAFAELLFTPQMWPDFGAADLTAAIGEFRRRERRFGAVSLPVHIDHAQRAAS
ncbi:MAG TPA: di-trans,poly-cis-decaprenylcistransferase [Acidobacteriota bacterium]|jgi:undecaprenyl diphosphate synthase